MNIDEFLAKLSEDKKGWYVNENGTIRQEKIMPSHELIICCPITSVANKLKNAPPYLITSQVNEAAGDLDISEFVKCDIVIAADDMVGTSKLRDRILEAVGL